MKLLLRWFVIMIALVIAANVVPGIRVEGANGWVTFGIVAIVLSLVNALVKPILVFLSCGFIFLTMGLFLLVINAFVLWLTAWVSVNWLNIGFYVDGFVPALLGSIIVSLVTLLLGGLFKDD